MYISEQSFKISCFYFPQHVWLSIEPVLNVVRNINRNVRFHTFFKKISTSRETPNILNVRCKIRNIQNTGLKYEVFFIEITGFQSQLDLKF